MTNPGPTAGRDQHTRSERKVGLGVVPAEGARAPLRFFVSDRLAPRRRRASDFFRLIAGFTIFALLGWAASKDPTVDRRMLSTLSGLPGWIESLSWAAFTVGSIVVLAVVGVAVVRAGRGRGVIRDLAVALGLAGIVGVVAVWATGTGSPGLLPEVSRPAGLPPFPALRVTGVLVATMVLSPYVTSTIKRLLGWSTAAVVITPMLLGVASVTSWSGAIVLSTASVAAVRVLFGTPEGLPTLSHLTGALAQAGTTVNNVRYRDRQPGTVGLATATSIDGEPLDIKVYGVEAANRQRAERIWNALWYKSAGPAPGAGRNEQAQHEALALMSARTAGVDVPTVRAAGRTTDGDVLLVTSGVRGTALHDLVDATADHHQSDHPDHDHAHAHAHGHGHDDVSETDLALMWSTLVGLHHRARITHGRIDETTIRLHDTGVQLTDFAQSSLLPTQQQIATDIVSMLAVQAIAVGVDRALTAAVTAIDADDLTACLPFVQEAVLAPHLRSALRRSHVKAGRLRNGLAERLGVDAPRPAPIKRVQGRDVLVAAIGIIAANAVIGQIANIGLNNFAAALATASAGWFAVAFVLKFVGFADGAWALRSLTDQPLPMLPTTLLQSAKGFVGLAVPNIAGQNGLDLRFLQKQGVPLSVSASQGPINSVIEFVAKMVLLIWSGRSIGQNIDAGSLSSSGGGTLLAIAVGVVIVGAVVVVAVPRWRTAVIGAVRDLGHSVHHMLSSPRTVLSVFASQVIGILLAALSLAAVVAAFGAGVSFPAVVFTVIGTSMLSGLTPVPSGIGVAEATMSGILTSVGLSPELSVTVAITYRMLTSYLPPVLGFFSFRWLTRHGYL